MLSDKPTTYEIYNYVCNALNTQMIIHYYKAFSTNSIYLKFDYGAANSLRISDHKGKSHLSYIFNILLNINHYYREVTSKSYIKEYFLIFMIDDCINSIILNKRTRQDNYKDYNSIVEKCKNTCDKYKGFWSHALPYKKGD